MKCLVQVGALGLTLHEDGPTDPNYERRSIVLDAERAAKSPGTPEKLCFWAKGTPQHDLWMRIYSANLGDAS